MKHFRRTASLCTGLALILSATPAYPVQAEETLPSGYDLRAEGLVTAVRDQEGYENSWAFAAIGSIETSLLADDPEIDLSEWHLSYYAYSHNFGYPYTTDSLFDAGTYDIRQETGLLTAGLGPVSEGKAPAYGDRTIEDSMLTLEEVRSQAEYRVTDAVWYPYDVPEENPADDTAFAAQRDAVKTAVMQGHAIDAGFLYRADCFDFGSNAYCYSAGLPDAQQTGPLYRCVCIVGWDDAFPSAAFPAAPGMNGAWLCKDSQGVNWGDNGYFWLSYADPSLDGLCAMQAESVKCHDRLYQHDDFGCSGRFSFAEGGDTSVTAANVFTAEEDGWLTSLLFCNAEPGTKAEFTVYTGLTDPGHPASGTAHEAASVTFERAGYQTVNLEAPVSLTEGEVFSVAVKLSGETPAARIPCEFATQTVLTHADGTNESFDSGFTMEMLGRSFAPGQSFYSPDGALWYDMYGTVPKTDSAPEADGGTRDTYMRWGNICLKALTVDSGKVQFSTYKKSLAPGETVTLTSLDQAPIYYTLDGTTWELYEEPIAMPEDASELSLSAYADMEIVGMGNDKVLWSHRYTKRTPVLTSLLCRDAGFAAYAEPDEDDPSVLTYTVPAGTKTLEIVPTATGMVTVGETACTSGQPLTLTLDPQQPDISVTVEEEGLAPAVYTLRVHTLFLLGDVDDDGDADAADASRILQAAAESGLTGTVTVLTATQQTAADVNGDTEITATDASAVLQYAAAAGLGQDVSLSDFI